MKFTQALPVAAVLARFVLAVPTPISPVLDNGLASPMRRAPEPSEAGEDGPPIWIKRAEAGEDGPPIWI